jgi:hypothetical protein
MLLFHFIYSFRIVTYSFTHFTNIVWKVEIQLIPKSLKNQLLLYSNISLILPNKLTISTLIPTTLCSTQPQTVLWHTGWTPFLGRHQKKKATSTGLPRKASTSRQPGKKSDKICYLVHQFFRKHYVHFHSTHHFN